MAPLFHSARGEGARVGRIVVHLMVVISLFAMAAWLLLDESDGAVEAATRAGIVLATLIGSGVAALLSARGRLGLGVACGLCAIMAAVLAHAVIGEDGIHSYVLMLGVLMIFGAYIVVGLGFGHALTALGITGLLGLYAAEAAGLAFQGRAWPVSARNVLVLHLLCYGIAAVSAARYRVYFESLMRGVEREQGRFRELFHALPVGCMLSKDGVVLEANERYAHHCGLRDAGIMIGKRLIDLVQPEALGLMRERLALAETIAPGQEFPPTQYRLRGAGGGPRIIEARTHRVPLALGEAFLTITLDATEHRTAVETLAAERERAKAASRAKSALLAALSEEVGPPLDAILGTARALRGEPLTRETERRYLAQLDDLAQTLASMLDDAGDLSRIASGALQLHVEPVDVRAILHRCTALAMESIGEREVRILTDVDVGVPLVLMTDGARLAQVLSILLAGAVRATRRGTVRVAAAATAAGALRIVVSDQGAGLAGGEFESPTLPRGGTRLADALARELAVLMGGACWVDREVGVGSTASLEVPLHTPAANAAHGFAPRAPLRPERQYPGTHVLVIDGNEINGLVIQAVLALRGAQTQVLTGIEQLATLGQGTRIDLAIVDADAPSSDVARAAAAIRGLDSARAAPVIAFAAQKPDWFQKGGTPAGVVDWLPKPPSEAALLSMMERWAVAVPAAAET